MFRNTTLETYLLTILRERGARRPRPEGCQGAAWDDEVLRMRGASSTALCAGTTARPLQIVRVTLVNDGPGMVRDPGAAVTVAVTGPSVSTPQPPAVTGLQPGEERAVEVAVQIAAPLAARRTRQVTAVAAGPQSDVRAAAQIVVAEPGWTMWMVSHFHYAPVWGGTQGQFTQTRLA